MQAWGNYEQVKGLTESSLLQSAAMVATEEKNEIVAARDALEGHAELGEVLSFVHHDCKQALLRFNARSKDRFANLMVMRHDGVVACAIDLEQQHSIASSDWFVSTLRNETLSANGDDPLHATQQTSLVAHPTWHPGTKEEEGG